jgi:D-galactarolactone cycloisomerase
MEKSRGSRLKITDVKTYLIHAPIPGDQRVESGAGLKFARQMCLIEVKTSDGLAGYGSPSGPYDLPSLERIVQSVLAPHIIGEDAGNIEHLWHRLYHGEVARNLGNRGIGVAALSGLDIALWDLKSRGAGMPLYQLLGGCYHREGVRAYASSIYWDLTPAEAVDQALEQVAKGFGALKLKVGRDLRKDVERVNAIRKAVGDGVELLADANQALSRIEALALLPALEDAGVYWFEEPTTVDDIEGHQMLRNQRRRVRIASGESLYTRFSFAEFVRQGALDVLQADVSRAGGVTEVRKIADTAAVHHLDWNPHTFNDILTTVANLHLVAASPHPAMFEWDITHNDLMTKLAMEPLEVEDGLVAPPEGTGLGINIDWSFVAAHPWNGEPSIGLGYGMKR